MRLLIILFITAVSAATNLRAASQGSMRYQNLENPTRYIYRADAKRVEEVLGSLRHATVGRLYVFRTEPEGYRLSAGPYYSPRYWRGRQEQEGEVSPSSAGKIGEIDAWFFIRLTPQGEQTLVSIEVDKFEQQIGRTYAIFPHFRKVPRLVKVKSDTYFEYYFLRKLGEMLGEKDMPPLKGSDDEPAATAGKQKQLD